MIYGLTKEAAIVRKEDQRELRLCERMCVMLEEKTMHQTGVVYGGASMRNG